MDNSGTEEAKFDEMIQDYLEAFNAGDYRRVASHWAEDGVHQPPMGPEIRGRAALEEFYRQSSEAMNAQISDHSYECRFAGDHVLFAKALQSPFIRRARRPSPFRAKGLG